MLGRELERSPGVLHEVRLAMPEQRMHAAL